METTTQSALPFGATELSSLPRTPALVVATLVVVPAIVQMLPLIGAGSAGRLAALYGVPRRTRLEQPTPSMYAAAAPLSALGTVRVLTTATSATRV